VSSQNVLTKVPQRRLIVGAAVTATALALVLDLTDYQQFLLLLGAFFVPLFGVLLADWLLNGAHYEPDDVFRAPAFRPGMIVAWLAGFAVYEWFAQTQDLGFWTDFLARLNPPESGIGASLPGFATAFALAAAVSFASRRVSQRRARAATA
jgi:nucleobase:cation symporter-1, NCS1 family